MHVCVCLTVCLTVCVRARALATGVCCVCVCARVCVCKETCLATNCGLIKHLDTRFSHKRNVMARARNVCDTQGLSLELTTVDEANAADKPSIHVPVRPYTYTSHIHIVYMVC